MIFGFGSGSREFLYDALGDHPDSIPAAAPSAAL